MGLFSHFLNTVSLGIIPDSGAPTFDPSGYDAATGHIKSSSATAAGLLRQGYEDAHRARAAGYVGGQNLAEQQAGGQLAGQRLSPDVAARMLNEERITRMQQLAGGEAQGAYGLHTQLAELEKGTGTELAGIAKNKADASMSFDQWRYGNESAQIGQAMSLFSAAAGGMGGGAGAGAPGGNVPMQAAMNGGQFWNSGPGGVPKIQSNPYIAGG